MKNVKLLETLMELGYVENVAKGQRTKLVKQYFGAELTEREQKELDEVSTEQAIEILKLIASRKTIKLDVKEKAIKKIVEFGGEWVEIEKKAKKEPKEKLTMKVLNEKIKAQDDVISKIMKENEIMKKELSRISKMMTSETPKEDKAQADC